MLRKAITIHRQEYPQMPRVRSVTTVFGVDPLRALPLPPGGSRWRS